MTMTNDAISKLNYFFQILREGLIIKREINK